MNLYLVRHGEAKGGSPDSKRELTENGISSIKNSIQLWKQYFTKADYIITSPLKRTKQTAEIIKNEFYNESVLCEDFKLAPGSSSEDLLEVVNVIDAEDIIVVGHMPDLAYHVSFFISYSGSKNTFEPGAIAAINFENGIVKGSGTLKFLIPPIK
ncbi:MAG: phosphohistidine phosphatase SixA [Ignavibacteriae bacterium]|nr:phosphohistidine phosphatase SixA [Ignavibacteriota bacterium]NOG97407.1 phosphohistidine phosphatase SixA [Ignavibacteriota bacterium]